MRRKSASDLYKELAQAEATLARAAARWAALRARVRRMERRADKAAMTGEVDDIAVLRDIPVLT